MKAAALFVRKTSHYKTMVGVDCYDETRDAYYDNGEETDATTAECIVAKNRHGEVGKVDLGWDGAHTRFTNVDYAHG